MVSFTPYCKATTRGRYAPGESILDNLGVLYEKNAFGGPRTAQPTQNRAAAHTIPKLIRRDWGISTDQWKAGGGSQEGKESPLMQYGLRRNNRAKGAC